VVRARRVGVASWTVDVADAAMGLLQSLRVDGRRRHQVSAGCQRPPFVTITLCCNDEAGREGSVLPSTPSWEMHAPSRPRRRRPTGVGEAVPHGGAVRAPQRALGSTSDGALPRRSPDPGDRPAGQDPCWGSRRRRASSGELPASRHVQTSNSVNWSRSSPGSPQDGTTSLGSCPAETTTGSWWSAASFCVRSPSSVSSRRMGSSSSSTSISIPPGQTMTRIPTTSTTAPRPDVASPRPDRERVKGTKSWKR
jgi:hypothetical protein